MFISQGQIISEVYSELSDRSGGAYNWDLFTSSESYQGDVVILEITVAIANGSIKAGSTYGGLSPLTNGITIALMDSNDSALMTSIISSNPQLAGYAKDFAIIQNDGGDDLLFARISFLDSHGGGLRVNRNAGEYLRITFNDNFLNLNHHEWRVMGYLVSHGGPIEKHNSATGHHPNF